jgi:hypothetical protein
LRWSRRARVRTVQLTWSRIARVGGVHRERRRGARVRAVDGDRSRWTCGTRAAHRQRSRGSFLRSLHLYRLRDGTRRHTHIQRASKPLDDQRRGERNIGALFAADQTPPQRNRPIGSPQRDPPVSAFGLEHRLEVELALDDAHSGDPLEFPFERLMPATRSRCSQRHHPHAHRPGCRESRHEKAEDEEAAHRGRTLGGRPENVKRVPSAELKQRQTNVGVAPRAGLT